MLATLAISWPQVWAGLAVTAFLAICVVLVLTILIQKPQGGGLAGAFGSSAGSGQTAFGAKTGDALTVFTIGVFVLYIGGAIGLNYLQRPTKVDPNAPAAQAAPGTGGTGATENSGTPLPADTGTGSPFPALPATTTPATAPSQAPTAPAAPEGQAPAAPATPVPAPAPAPAPTPAPTPAPGQ